jgi:hypothetical protein
MTFLNNKQGVKIRRIGTVIRGIRAPIIKPGDNVVGIIVNSLRKSWEPENLFKKILGIKKYDIKNKDIVGITESFISRAQGNFISIEDISEEVSSVFNDDIGIVFPILSRNRFSMILKAIARGASKNSKKVILQLSYPDDEVGNPIMDKDRMFWLKINPYRKALSEKEYNQKFGDFRHPFTKINYVHYYREIIESENAEAVIILSNDPKRILRHTKQVIAADIHTRQRTKKILKEGGADIVLGLDNLCTAPLGGRGHNEDYGLLGSNKSREEFLKLFPRTKDRFGRRYVEMIQKKIKKLTGKNVEVMIYADGAFKDPVCGIWELADPVVSPDFTSGLRGTPNEIKLKYLADNLRKLNKKNTAMSVKKYIMREKKKNLSGDMSSQGTTPRQYTDLIGSLCDLTSGSGDKGTPIILIQGYFDDYTKKD